MDAVIAPALVAIGGYLLGAIPFGLLLTRMTGAGDLRAIGSGNIGATNVLRTGRKGLAALTLVLDAAKGAVAVLLAEAVLPGSGPLAAVGAFFGHLFPVWLRFRGGKGVATYLGVVLALYWPCGLVFAAAWILGLGLSRISSVGALTAALATPVASAFFYRADLTLLFLAFSIALLWTHRANIARLIGGEEPRVGDRGDGGADIQAGGTPA